MDSKRGIRRLWSSFFVTAYRIYAALVIIAWPVLAPLNYIIGPFLTYIKLKDPLYIRNYPEYVKRGFQNLFCLLKHGGMYRSFRNNYLLSKKKKELQLSKRRGKCLQCGECCRKIKCPFLEQDMMSKRWICMVHDRPTWRVSGCPLFPFNQEEVDQFGCKGFWFEE